jgi:BlaI family transcriptional regulator, penicillinase repressor
MKTPSTGPLGFGKLQHRIMRVLWEAGAPMSARDLTDALNAARDPAEPACAHSTVQTLLRQLEDRDVVGHTAEGRTFLFFAKIEQENSLVGTVRDFVGRVFSGRPSSLVMNLLKDEDLSAEELAEIRRLVEAKARAKKGTNK